MHTALQVPITLGLLYALGAQSRHLYSELAASLWSTVADWAMQAPGVDNYYAWDTLTAACFLEKDLCR